MQEVSVTASPFQSTAYLRLNCIMSNKDKNFYEVLNLSRDCKPEELKKSFIKLSKEFHPDINKAKDAHQKFVLINEAYTTLSNPTKRKQYDDYVSMRRKYDINASRDSQEGSFNWRKYDYTSHQYSHSKESNNSYSGSRNASEKRNKIMEEKSIVASLILKEAKRQAKLMGNEKQMERLKEGKLGVSESDIFIYQYMKARNSLRRNSN